MHATFSNFAPCYSGSAVGSSDPLQRPVAKGYVVKSRRIPDGAKASVAASSPFVRWHELTIATGVRENLKAYAHGARIDELACRSGCGRTHAQGCSGGSHARVEHPAI